MYSKIILCLREKEDNVLEKQIAMLKERHHAEIERISLSDAADYISGCEDKVLFISDDKGLLEKAKNMGIAINDPQKMRESYTKAMEMLKAILGLDLVCIFESEEQIRNMQPTLTETYSPEIHHLNEEKTVLAFEI